ncbi:hypothetical protein XELAEV_18037634mg [Xenopus laevis]|uniref:Uncharacterized protein n=1 Tax=Xenopus laevis TaxID=8355 RepID=A0A974CCF6_XENLA|nr:hypothetical protein XELAEV_18037634mg [Xenopus laevis]
MLGLVNGLLLYHNCPWTCIYRPPYGSHKSICFLCIQHETKMHRGSAFISPMAAYRVARNAAERVTLVS